jgi:hypothetical protein
MLGFIPQTHKTRQLVSFLQACYEWAETATAALPAATEQPIYWQPTQHQWLQQQCSFTNRSSNKSSASNSS